MAEPYVPEIQTCPRRMCELGPQERKEGLDRWVKDRWSPDIEVVRRLHAAEDARSPGINRGPSNDLWVGPGDVPRTCNYCGGIHPDDAITLLSLGWESEGTDKSYKKYLHPPGFFVRYQQMLDGLRDRLRGDGAPPAPAWDPTPPVKVYIQHWDEAQCARANEIIHGRVQPPPAPPTTV